MQHLLKTIIPFAAAVLLSACAGNGNSEKNSDTEANHDHAAMEQNKTNASTKPVLKNDKLNAVYQHYIHLTTALTNGDEAEAKVAANAIEAGAKEVNGASAIETSAAKITTASGIEAQRKMYEAMSNDMITLVKKEGLANGELYIVHCPMAFNDKGASWISGNKEIRNPYFGDKMINCGAVKETIN
ncbi:DUF3347 domain-containing protein [Agriterribacter sp.]|jgi:type IV pilus biogenesis protein CpaD/CtpE|uniref:DUF3347 domain-containing protein n=1 Tax=Agriterribacter sp. TaxID=2821509 RepID=UPI002B626911|nr:DUF3347 domain-containing protein [Agriterribacter sp.]HRO48253.1 DUF3347 domain-containing protein [Agriterribacter sp.]HRQ19544.1 DUF3347 domain-containing protein [Agriterribacter sp.]